MLHTQVTNVVNGTIPTFNYIDVNTSIHPRNPLPTKLGYSTAPSGEPSAPRQKRAIKGEGNPSPLSSPVPEVIVDACRAIVSQKVPLDPCTYERACGLVTWPAHLNESGHVDHDWAKEMLRLKAKFFGSLGAELRWV